MAEGENGPHVLSTCGNTTPFPVSISQPVGHRRSLENTDIYFAIHNNSKITVKSSNGNNLMVGGLPHHKELY